MSLFIITQCYQLSLANYISPSIVYPVLTMVGMWYSKWNNSSWTFRND